MHIFLLLLVLKKGVVILTNLISLESFAKEKKFNRQVLSFVRSHFFHFSYYINDNEALLIIDKMKSSFIFFSFIPFQEKTNLPTLSQRFFSTPPHSRTSEGEWLVSKMFSIENDTVHEIKDMFHDQFDSQISLLKKELESRIIY